MQVAGSGSETHSVINTDGSTTPLEDTSQLSNGSAMMNPLQIAAPAYQWVFAGGPNFATLGQLLVPYNPASAFAQTLGVGIGGGLGWWAKGTTSAIGAASGAYGGYKQGGWNGALAGAAAGAATGGILGSISPFTGLAGVGWTSGTGAASGAIGAGAANFATGSPLSNGMPAASAIGALAPLASGEAMIVGGAGVVGPVADALNGLSAVFGAFATAVSP